MAKKTKLAALNLALLSAAAVATTNGSFIYVADADAAPFLTHTPPLMEQNPTLQPDASGNKATRATTEGVAYSAANPAPVEATADTAAVTEEAKPTFKLFDNVTLPSVKRGGGNTAGSSMYPFDTMLLKQAFFVPATEAKPNPAKGLASTVSSATRKHSVPVLLNGAPVMEQYKGKDGAMLQRAKTTVVRKFELRKIADGKDYGYPGVGGALISRTL